MGSIYSYMVYSLLKEFQRLPNTLAHSGRATGTSAFPSLFLQLKLVEFFVGLAGITAAGFGYPMGPKASGGPRNTHLLGLLLVFPGWAIPDELAIWQRIANEPVRNKPLPPQLSFVNDFPISLIFLMKPLNPSKIRFMSHEIP